MNLYAESSAVLTWLLNEPAASRVASELASADLVLTSELTPLECDRALVRLAVVDPAEADHVPRLQARLNQVLAHWVRLALDDFVLERARVSFPVEPIRTLDALHLAAAVKIRSSVPDLLMLSLDRRIRENASRLGFDLLPEDPG